MCNLFNLLIKNSTNTWNILRYKDTKHSACYEIRKSVRLSLFNQFLNLIIFRRILLYLGLYLIIFITVTA